MEPAYSQQTQLLPPHPRTLCVIQGSNLHGASQNLTLKLNAVPGAPLEKQTAAKAPESARRRGEFWQATSHKWYSKAIASAVFVRGIRVA